MCCIPRHSGSPSPAVSLLGNGEKRRMDLSRKTRGGMRIGYAKSELTDSSS